MLIQAYRQLGNGKYMKLDSMILKVSVPSESNADVGGRFMASLVGRPMKVHSRLREEPQEEPRYFSELQVRLKSIN